MGLQDIPSNFARRISNLIDLGAGIPNSRRAGQKGVDQEYEIEDAFELGIGLDLLGLGLHQREIVNFLIGFREELRGHCASMPSKPRIGSDPAFLIVRPVGLRETLRKGKMALETGPLAFHEPLLVQGKSKIENALLNDNASMDARRHLVIEVGDLKTKLVSYLDEAPETKRGRQ